MQIASYFVNDLTCSEAIPRIEIKQIAKAGDIRGNRLVLSS